MDTDKQAILRNLINGFYDIQHTRIQTGNRLTTQFKRKMGIQPSQKESKSAVASFLKELKQEHKRLCDSMLSSKKVRENFQGAGIISDYSEFVLVNSYFEQIKQEDIHLKEIEAVCETFSVYTSFLKNVKGVGPTMAGVILSYIDIRKAKYASSIIKYCGLDVINGEARGRKAEHLIDVTYQDTKGKEKTKKSLSYNPFVRSKLRGVLASVFLKCKSPYRTVYDNYKNRLQNHPVHKEKTVIHRHNMALRYMIKMFLIDLYREWKEAEGLEAYPPYHEAKLGLKHQEEK